MSDPDGLMRLYTPHRMAYIRGGDDPAPRPEPSCPFCAMVAGDQADADDLVVARGAETFAVLNLYPYNPGHLMVLPYRHVADYTDLTDTETDEVSAMTKSAIRAVRAVAQPDAFNVGLNLGRSAGGSLAAHLHQHVVPRWSGDSNFMTVIGGTKTLPQLLVETRDLLRGVWES
ncbi:HIT domain-containing protein [Nocardioides zeae]|uniref:HIT domain-containing protein n=1 Tax=Nocardioides imazamoxiresistens TaxID=3231893 RepID=A0ABU3PTJ4_9ACTN|nr:HIT domain-containing protein [Nocardioides zeae]MDT9592528.1 HIT domain-containing protein [Nocardioides zeae]